MQISKTYILFTRELGENVKRKLGHFKLDGSNRCQRSQDWAAFCPIVED